MAEGGNNVQKAEGHDSVIISDVIDGVRQSFVDSGVDMEVLEKLQQLWISKLEANPSQGLSVRDVRAPVRNCRVKGAGPRKAAKRPVKEESMEEPVVDADDDESLIQTGSLPIIISSSSGVEDIFRIPSDDDEEEEVHENVHVPKVKHIKSKQIIQLDGPADSSDDEDGVEEDEDGDDDDDDDDDDNDPDGDEEDEGVEEEPLGSEDDISDEDASDLFDTENVVVCQYDKITRARNKWKFHLKDGIMNLNGKDYVFARANGDAEW